MPRRSHNPRAQGKPAWHSQRGASVVEVRRQRGTSLVKLGRQCGATVVEFALVAPLLLFLLMACMELSALFWANLTMQYAVREGVRYAITGRSDLDSGPKPQRHLAVMKKIQDSSMGLYGLLNPAISINNGTAAVNADAWTPNMFGRPGDILVVRLDCTWPVMTPLIRPFLSNGKLRFSVAATMRNEAFPS